MRPPLALPPLALVLLAACAHVPTTAERTLAENYYDQGVLAVKADRPQEALKLFEDAIHENPALPEPHAALGLLYWWSYADGAKAKAELETALRLKPDFPEAANNLGTLLTELKDYGGAEKAYNRALGEPLYKTPYVAQVNLGWLAHLEGNDVQAEQLIRRALLAEPGYCVGHRELAKLLDATGRGQEATEHWQRFAELCPKDPEALLHGATLLAAKGDAVGAAKNLELCLEKAGARPIARDCRAALAKLPPLPPEAADPKPPAEIQPGTRELDDTH